MPDYTTYNILLKQSTSGSEFSTVAGIISVDGMSAKNPKVAGVPVNGVQTWISSGLTEYGDAKIKASFDKAAVGTYENYVLSGSQIFYQIVYPGGPRTYQFKSLVTAFNAGAADNTKPDLQTCEIILSPSGSVVIS
jgi:hypothetical protein